MGGEVERALNPPVDVITRGRERASLDIVSALFVVVEIPRSGVGTAWPEQPVTDEFQGVKRAQLNRAALRVSPASKFSERYLSCPLNFSTFRHFLKPTTTWIVLTKPSSTLLCEKNLAPSKVGLNRKRSDFSDLPNGLQEAGSRASP